MKRRAAWTAGALVLLLGGLAGLVVASSAQRAHALVRHRGARPAVTPADSGLAGEVVPFAATDGTPLEGWWIVPRDSVRRRDLASVILCHPEDDSLAVATGLSGKARVLPQAAALARAGFIVLAFDFRSYGGSAGQATTGGYLERKDLAGAIELVAARCVGAPIILWGRGMGGTVALEAGAEAGEAGAGVVQLVVDEPRETWNEAVLDRALPRRGPGAPGPLDALAASAVTRFFVAREILGEYDGDRSRFGGPLVPAADSSLVVLSRGPGAYERAPAAYCARLVRAITGRLDALAAARARAP